MSLALCRDCGAEYPDTSLANGRCWVCALGADPPTAVHGSERRLATEVERRGLRIDPCTSLRCMAINPRGAAEPVRLTCPRCGAPTVPGWTHARGGRVGNPALDQTARPR